MSEALWLLKAYPFMVLQACKWWAGIPETTKIKSVDGISRYIGKALSEEKMEDQRNKQLNFKRALRYELRNIHDRVAQDAKREELEEELFKSTEDTFNDPYRLSNILEIEVTNEFDQKEKVAIRDWDTYPVVDTWFTMGSNLLSDPHVGSAGIGIAIFTLPFTLPLSPLLLTVNGLYSLLEKAWGMSRRTHRLYSRLVNSDLLNDSDKRIVKQACLNMEKEWINQVEHAKRNEELERQIYTS